MVRKVCKQLSISDVTKSFIHAVEPEQSQDVCVSTGLS